MTRAFSWPTVPSTAQWRKRSSCASGFEQLPVIIGSLLLAAGAAIIISTGNTFLMVTSTNVTRDIVQAFFFKNANPKQIVVIQRVTIIGIGVLAFLMMSQFETILEMALISYTMIGASLAPALLAAFFWKRVSRIGGLASIASGMLTVIGIAVMNSIYKDRRRWRTGTGRVIPDGHGLYRDPGSNRIGPYASTRQPGDSQTR